MADRRSSCSFRFLIPDLVLIMTGLILVASCDTIVSFGLKDATYELYDARMPEGLEGNALLFLMPGYKENHPAYRYEIHFYGKGRCTGTYYAADTVNYEVEGTWSLPEHDVLRIALDRYVDGDFQMTKLEKDIFYLATEQNYINLIGPDTIALQMFIKRIH